MLLEGNGKCVMYLVYICVTECLALLYVGLKCYHNYMLVYYVLCMCVAYATHNYMLVNYVLCMLPMQRITICWCTMCYVCCVYTA